MQNQKESSHTCRRMCAWTLNYDYIMKLTQEERLGYLRAHGYKFPSTPTLEDYKTLSATANGALTRLLNQSYGT